MCSAPLTESATYNCSAVYGAGYSGTLTEARDKGPAPGCAWGAWYRASSSCVYTPPVCAAPTSQSRTVGCDAVYGPGYSGTVWQQHDKSSYPGCSWGGWYETGNNCVYAPPCSPSTSSSTASYGCWYIGQPSWTGSVDVLTTSTTYSPGGCAANSSSSSITSNTCAPPAVTPCPFNGSIDINNGACQQTSCSGYKTTDYPTGNPFQAYIHRWYERYITVNGYYAVLWDSTFYVSGAQYVTYDLWGAWTAYGTGNQSCGGPAIPSF
ncbi:MAG: hypothetical protein K2X99_09810 [Gemmatimonadaceae bacterium]|nr:hypothetical protein [Gemmatimonadaceae bacterium]